MPNRWKIKSARLANSGKIGSSRSPTRYLPFATLRPSHPCAVVRTKETGPLRARSSSSAWGRRRSPSRGEQLPALWLPIWRIEATGRLAAQAQYASRTCRHNGMMDMPAMQNRQDNREACGTRCNRLCVIASSASDEAIQNSHHQTGLLRFVRNDGRS